MRTFEIVSCVFVFLSSGLLLLPSAVRLFLVVNSLMVVALGIQVFHEGPHWQLFPLYLAAVILLAGTSRLPSRSRRLKAVVGGLILLLAIGTTALTWLFPMFQLPKLSGTATVGTRILHVIDQSRAETGGSSPSGKRELMIQVWYPAEPSGAEQLAVYQRRKELTVRASYRSVLRTHSYLDAQVRRGGPYPVVLYNPGWMGERTEGTYQMEELASHGFIAVAIDHTFYGGLVEFPDGRVADSRNAPTLGSFENSTVEEQWSLGDKYVRIEAQDDAAVLDRLSVLNQDAHTPWFHQMDFTRVGAMGFSIGGAVAAQAAFQDPRIKVALNLDGWTFGDVAAHGLSKPMMVIYEDRGQTLPTPDQLRSGPIANRLFWQTSAQDFVHVTQSLHANGGFMAFIAGTRHVDFTDRSLFSPLASVSGRGSLDPARTHKIVNAYTLAFFMFELNGVREPLLETLPSPFSEVEFERFSGESKSAP